MCASVHGQHASPHRECATSELLQRRQALGHGFVLSPLRRGALRYRRLGPSCLATTRAHTLRSTFLSSVSETPRQKGTMGSLSGLRAQHRCFDTPQKHHVERLSQDENSSLPARHLGFCRAASKCREDPHCDTSRHYSISLLSKLDLLISSAIVQSHGPP